MLRTRVIPALLLRNESLVKTVRFGKFSYVGDPCNSVRIFNELEVDEYPSRQNESTQNDHALKKKWFLYSYENIDSSICLFQAKSSFVGLKGFQTPTSLTEVV